MERRWGEEGFLELSFEFRKQRYCYVSDDNVFERLRFPDKVLTSL